MQHVVEMREKLFTMRMSTDEADRCESVAKHYGLSVAGVLRLLVKREHDTIARDVSLLEARTSGLGGRHSAEAVAGRRARAETEAATGASLALPSFFRASLASAKNGGSSSYEHAGYTLATHMRDLCEGAPEAIEALDKAIGDKKADEAMWQWLRNYLPRCFEIVPAKKRDAFLKGVMSAIENSDV